MVQHFLVLRICDLRCIALHAQNPQGKVSFGFKTVQDFYTLKEHTVDFYEYSKIGHGAINPLRRGQFHEVALRLAHMPHPYCKPFRFIATEQLKTEALCTPIWSVTRNLPYYLFNFSMELPRLWKKSLTATLNSFFWRYLVLAVICEIYKNCLVTLKSAFHDFSMNVTRKCAHKSVKPWKCSCCGCKMQLPDEWQAGLEKAWVHTWNDSEIEETISLSHRDLRI